MAWVLDPPFGWFRFKINPMYYVLWIDFKNIIWALSSRQLSGQFGKYSGHNDKDNNLTITSWLWQWSWHCTLAVPAWNAALSQVEKKDIERIQKTALHIILGDYYHSYVNALDIVGLESLEARRHKLCLKFARKAAAHPKHRNWFKLNMNTVNTRH